MEKVNKYNASLKEFLHYDRYELIAINVFWLGFIAYIASSTILSTKEMPFMLFQPLQLLGLAAIFASSAYLLKPNFESEYFKIFFFLFTLWALVILFRGFSFNKNVLKLIFLNPWFGGMFYLVPLVVLFRKSFLLYKKLFSAIILLSVIFLLFSIMFRGILTEVIPDDLNRSVVEYFTKSLGITALFILFTHMYHSKTKNFFAFVVIVVVLILGVIRARRGLLFMAGLGLLMAGYIYFISAKSKLLSGTILLALLFFAVIGGVYVFLNVEMEALYYLQDRGVTDTRSGIEIYFYKDMQGLDWIIGRGMRGEYYCPTMESGNYRGTVETDYLNMILKGGIINLVLLLVILIPAIFLGLFSSKNYLTKAFALWILFWLINTHPSTVQVFTMNYFLVWFGVGVCYSPFIRSIPEEKMKSLFKPVE
ncbi:hypothetical protein [Cyclobacterium amurskyense]|uniref:O-antigen polymerase n=1 Tax=Cyclobacterium amurskyense TaxID=320787 RepID=A0A0H4PAG1_9BACT|nr:hypothetical protein [Cyclobacterium amurskyense]AKP50120.1 hypothetical protein CA2015_0656 [Cyclobacterium amurskyense]